MNRTGLSRGAQAALRAIGLDVEGFVLNFERYATHVRSSFS